jgi:hypothetical protein
VAFLSFNYQLPTGITLVPPGILVPTQGALTPPPHEAFSKDPLSVQLVHTVLLGAGTRRCPGLSLYVPPWQIFLCSSPGLGFGGGVARVGDVVHVGEGGGDGDFPIPVVWEAET